MIRHNAAFYQKLGYLFYSVAASDGHVAAEEKKMLHAMVLEDWVNLEESRDEFGTDNAYQVEVLFDFLVEKEFPGERAYEVFEHYFKNHLELFTPEVTDRIYHTAGRIAASFHSMNKKELNSITRLHLLMNRERHIL